MKVMEIFSVYVPTQQPDDPMHR